MTGEPKIYLVHAQRVSIDPIEAAFQSLWPEARLAHLLEDSLFSDFGRDGGLTEAMIERFRALGRVCVGAGADAILFTCSAFGPAIDALKRDLRIPVLKPNEALYDELLDNGGRIALLATFAPTIPSMMAEITAYSGTRSAGEKSASLRVDAHLVEGALDALQNNRPDEHNRLIADASRSFATHDAIAFAQFSMAPARAMAEAHIRIPLLTTPDTAIRKLMTLMV